MKAVLQRVTCASLSISGAVRVEMGAGLLVFVGVATDDGITEADWMARKIAALRIFADDAGKMNLSLQETGGEALVVSQFTLLTGSVRGNRPGFSAAAPAEPARQLYERVAGQLLSLGIHTQTGVFGASMQVSLINDGPVTILLETPSGK